MASQVTEGIVTIAWAPCPPERMPALRYGINVLFDWLESLPDAPVEEDPLKVTILQASRRENHLSQRRQDANSKKPRAPRKPINLNQLGG